LNPLLTDGRDSALVSQPTGAGGGSNKAQKAVVNISPDQMKAIESILNQEVTA
jgi:hypothetical protein